MGEDEEYLHIRDHIERIEIHEQTAFDRLKEYYDETDLEPEGDVIPLEEPPHQLLLKQAAEILELAAIIETTEGPIGEGLSATHLFYLLTGIGMEQLLASIALKVDPDGFLWKVEDRDGRTPEWSWLKESLLDAADDLSEEQLERLEEVLDLIKSHRNNLVHFGFHLHTYGNHRSEILKIERFLLDRYSEEELDFSEGLEERRTELEDTQAGMQLAPVDFP